ncbi:MAG: ABC transporter ATP-binding protein [Chloroflexota bacterium]
MSGELLPRMPASACVLEARNLCVVLGGRKVLDVPSLKVEQGEVLVVIGPNGSGKTTLLLSLALLLKPASGAVLYRGAPVGDGSVALRLRRRFAVVFQEALLLNSNVWDNVTLGQRFRGVRKEEASARAQKWLERFGVLGLARRQAGTLSAGEAKRVSLARALALEPEIVFLDEPFSALDGPARQALIEDFQGVVRETGVTAVMVTHDRAEALSLAGRVAVLMDGVIRQVGSPQEVFSSPADGMIAGFVEAGNVLQGTVRSQSGGLASIAVGEHVLDAVSELSPGAEVALYLRYEDVTVLVPSSEARPSSARNHLKGRIVKLFSAGAQLKVTLDCGFPLVALVTRRSGDDLGLAVGQPVVASFKASSLHITRR